MVNENKDVQETSQDLEEVTPENTDQTSKSTQEDKPKMVTIEIPEGYEYTGDRKAVPKPLEKYVKEFDRYVSKKDQTLAETNKQLEEYKAVVDSNDFRQYQQYMQSKQVEPLTFTQAELDAISLGDGKALQSVIDRTVEHKFKTSLDPKLAEIEDRFKPLSQGQRELQYSEKIRQFSKDNADFSEMLESPIGDYMINAAKQGLALKDIYKNAKEIELYMSERIENKRKENIQKKKDGSTVKNTVTGKSDIVWAEDDLDARRKAIELQLKGDPRKVQIKPKK